MLRVHGNFAVQTAGNFSAAGTHRVVLNGAALGANQDNIIAVAQLAQLT